MNNVFIEQLRRDKFSESEGSENDRAYRRGWNAAIEHACSRIRIELGLVECRRSDDFVHDRFDLGGEG